MQSSRPISVGAALLAVGLLALAACSPPTEEAAPEPAPIAQPADDAAAGDETATGDGPTIVGRDDWAPFFEADGLAGTFALHQVGTEQVEVFDEARAAEAMRPASTFKILNSMIILETAVVDDVDTVIPWDGVDRGSPAWDRDQTLRSAIEVSAVWAYQAWARQVGDDEMQRWVTASAYGNEDIGGSIDSFWLDGDLRISALEQIDFLTRFVDGDLRFAPANQEAVREILVRESGPGWSWSHKTGWSLEAEPDLGWLVGIVDLETTSWVFALNVDLEADGRPVDPAVRLEVARAILEAEGVLPPS